MKPEPMINRILWMIQNGASDIHVMEMLSLLSETSKAEGLKQGRKEVITRLEVIDNRVSNYDYEKRIGKLKVSRPDVYGLGY